MSRRRTATAVLGLVLAATLVGAPGACAQATGTFSGTAVADGVRVNVSIPNYLLVEDFVDGGGPSAQAVLDSLGVSRAFASFPYPGEVGVSATGLVSTLTGLSLPSYPFVANSDHPVQPGRDIDQPGFHLNAHSDEQSSSGGARFGETTDGEALEGGGFSTATVTADEDGTVVARAETRFSLVLGPVALRGVRAVAEVVRYPDGTTEPSSSLVVGELDVGGVELALTDRGLVLAGTPLIPIDVVTGLTQALTLGETTIELVPAVVTEDSVMSAGLEITTSQQIDAIGHPVNVSYRLGNVLARATNAAFDDDAVPTLPLPEVGGTVLDGALPPFVTPAGSVEPPTARPAVPAPTITTRRVGNLVTVSSWAFFPVLALAGAALLGSTLGGRLQQARDTTRGAP